jgi:hypothetical protein
MTKRENTFLQSDIVISKTFADELLECALSCDDDPACTVFAWCPTYAASG